MKHSVTELPFNSFLGIEMASDPAHFLRLPAGTQYLNHLGTVHTSAHPDWTRRGICRSILSACESVICTAGFRDAVLVATPLLS